VEKLEKICGLIFIHVRVENQLCDLEIGARSERSPGIFFGWGVGRWWKAAVVVFQAENFIRLSTMWMVHNFDVVKWDGNGRWRGTTHFHIWKRVFK